MVQRVPLCYRTRHHGPPSALSRHPSALCPPQAPAPDKEGQADAVWTTKSNWAPDNATAYTRLPSAKAIAEMKRFEAAVPLPCAFSPSL